MNPARDHRNGTGNHLTFNIGLGNDPTSGAMGPTVGCGVNVNLSRVAVAAMETNACRLKVDRSTQTIAAVTGMLKVNLANRRSRALVLPGVGIGIAMLPNGYQGITQTNLSLRASWQVVARDESRTHGAMFEVGVLTASGRDRGHRFTMPFVRFGFFS